jgi:hypothetical protein
MHISLFTLLFAQRLIFAMVGLCYYRSWYTFYSYCHYNHDCTSTKNVKKTTTKEINDEILYEEKVEKTTKKEFGTNSVLVTTVIEKRR